MATREHGLFRLLEHPAPDAALGGCYVTHEAGPCVDTGVLIDFEGTLTLSVNTIRELAEVAGFSLNEEGKALEIENAHLHKLVADLTAELAACNEQLDAVGTVLARAANVKAVQ